MTDGLLIAEKQAELDLQGRKLRQAEEIERTLSAEISQSRSRVRLLRIDLSQAGATLICSSEAFVGYLNALDKCWRRLRSLSILGWLIIEGCQGYMDARLMNTIQRSEPLDERVGYALNDTLIEGWRAALAELAAGNGDVLLPSMRGPS
jgi:hypothetical protein